MYLGTFAAVFIACSILLPEVSAIEPYPTPSITTTGRPQQGSATPPRRPSLFERLFGGSFPQSPVIEVPFSGFGQRWRAVEMMMRYLDNEMSEMMRDLGSLIPIDRETEEWCVAHPVVTETNGTRIMRVTLDMRQFKPEEISVKVKDNVLYVNAKQESKNEFSMVYRQYSRQFHLPEGVDVNELRSTLSPEGVLTITAPLPDAEEDEEDEEGKEEEGGKEEEDEEEEEGEETATTPPQPTLPDLAPELLPESEREKKEETINIIHE